MSNRTDDAQLGECGYGVRVVGFLQRVVNN